MFGARRLSNLELLRRTVCGEDPSGTKTAESDLHVRYEGCPNDAFGSNILITMALARAAAESIEPASGGRLGQTPQLQRWILASE